MTKFLTTLELQAKVKEKMKKNNETFHEVLKDIYGKIKKKNDINTFYIMYKVPQLLIGKPLYNFDNLIIFLIKKLQKGGFLVYIKNDTLLIIWNIEHKKKEKVVKFKKNHEVRHYTEPEHEPEYKPSENLGKLTKNDLDKKMKELVNIRANIHYLNNT